MSRRDEQLRKERDQKIAETISKIYLSSLSDVLFSNGVGKDALEDVLVQLTEKVEMLTKGYIDLDTYIVSVEEKVGIKLK